ncbi:hypothetical protein [Acidisarcina polymorpha]|uniref:hypothetical protein n=1 Tax=Acidisarcina polymorpha TaxID=2211140 RepID=UPI001F1FB241|nr:hypothetical protein [Acidisarcina polymorpha]
MRNSNTAGKDIPDSADGRYLSLEQEITVAINHNPLSYGYDTWCGEAMYIGMVGGSVGAPPPLDDC